MALGAARNSVLGREAELQSGTETVCGHLDKDVCVLEAMIRMVALWAPQRPLKGLSICSSLLAENGLQV